MAEMKHLSEDLAYKYLETYPEVSWEEAMEYVCGEGSDEDEERRIFMALAKKCDRCGNFYEPYNMTNDSKNINGIMTLNLDNLKKYYSHEPLDLCPECKDAFEEWMKNGGKYDYIGKLERSN